MKFILERELISLEEGLGKILEHGYLF